MKKTLAAAITSALVIGAASTTFAAANPFSDVPADHWSYDAVAELAQDGIIDGYGDGTFRGDRAITRYEMAQMIARAMAKDVNGDAKATLDKLAAEYADELNNLGVRVSALEKKVDNTKFSGELRLRYRNDEKGSLDDEKTYPAMFQLKTESMVNDKWSVNTKSEVEYNLDGNDPVGSDNNHFVLKEAYAQGPLFGATAKLGKANYVAANGMIWDDPMTGAAFTWDTGAFNVELAAGILTDNTSVGEIVGSAIDGDDTDVMSLQLGYDFNDKFGMNAGYYQLKNNKSFGGDDNNIWSVGFGYAFNDNLKLAGTYAQTDVDTLNYNGATTSIDDDGYMITLDYKGANPADKGSFGIGLGYYDMAAGIALDPTGDLAADWGTKGWRINADYTIDENILWSTFYYDAEYKDDMKYGNSNDYKRFQTQVEFFF